MKKKIRIKLFRSLSDESGVALIIVLVLLLLGSLTIVPVLDHLHTALKTGEHYEEKTNMLYTADAGIEDGLWRIKYDFMGTDYDVYDFDTAWPYETDTLNQMVANITIKNVWLPSNVTLDDPDIDLSPAEAREMIESEKLVVVGTSTATPGQPYHIKIDFTPDVGDNLTIKSLGVWLPQGFEYADNCSLKFNGTSVPYYPDSEVVTDCNGGQTVVWTYNDDPYPLFTDFPGVDPAAPIMSIDFTFSYTPPAAYPNRLPTAIAWLTTEMSHTCTNPNDVPISWDMDTRIYEITSIAGDTVIQAFSSKCELRQMGDAMSGDYVAIGNSLMANDDPSLWDTYRETWYTPSSVTLDSIPADADVISAYLYWAGWFNESRKETKWSDGCSSFSPNWDPDPTSCWDEFDSYFKSDYDAGEDRELPMDSTITIPLGQYAGWTAVSVNWEHWETGTLESDDGLDFAISANDGATWSDYEPAFRNDVWGTKAFEYAIPNEYLTDDFKLKFKLVGFDGGDDGDCCIDDFKIKVMFPDTDVIFKIGNGTDEYQVYFDGGVPTSGSGNVTAGRSYVMRNELNGPYGFSYACTRDVSALVKKYPIVAGEEHHTGNAIYTIDGVGADNSKTPTSSDDSHLAFAGWSLIVVYASPQTAGHYIYIRDDNFAFHPGTGGNLDFDEDDQPGGDITNFIVPEAITNPDGTVNETIAAKLTCFVAEGDSRWSPEYVTITGQQSGISKDLSNPESPVSNVWNGKSYPGTFKEGVDIDTFELLWADNILTPGDNVLHVDLISNQDAWNLVYFIISVRSETVTGGTSHYMIFN